MHSPSKPIRSRLYIDPLLFTVSWYQAINLFVAFLHTHWTGLSAPVMHLDVFCYLLNCMDAQKKCAQTKILVSFFPYIFHIKTKRNIVYNYFKTEIFSRDTNILLQMHWTSSVCVSSAKTIDGVLGIIKLCNP